jgi:2-amino-4-hydroxy-6-hydroxymethyldihydropteridine diphosphokinase
MATAMAPPARGHQAAETTATTMNTTTNSSPVVRPSIAGKRSVESPSMDTVVGLGSNLGDRSRSLSGAAHEIAELGQVTAVSPLYETDAVGPPGPPFLNAALRLEWDGSARALLGALIEIEHRFGRVRRERWGPRTLDLDVLWIHGTSLAEPDLVVPHPRLRGRRFALAPLLDVAPDARHPTTGEALSAWLAELPGGGIRHVAEAGWVAAPLAAI